MKLNDKTKYKVVSDIVKSYNGLLKSRSKNSDKAKSDKTDYDLYFADDSKSASASLVVPFVMKSPSELTVAMWVQFETPGETGTYFTLYSVDR